LTTTDVDRVAKALLFEGRLPYRSQLGVIAPGEDMQTECLVEGDAATTFDVRVRFLQRLPHDPRLIEREIIGSATFEWPPLTAAVDVTTVRYADEMIRLRVRIFNLSNDPTHNMLATHTILRVSGGTFLSMIDPPAIYRALADSCLNVRTCPVLAGERGQYRTMLSSGIIVYDYPEIADEG
jgi:hypothetical protein